MLELHKRGLTVQDLVGHGKNKRGRSQSNIYGRLTALMRDGKVTQDDDGKWKIP
jgi:DNA-binding IclR family transcriptional regulator